MNQKQRERLAELVKKLVKETLEAEDPWKLATIPLN